MKQVQRIMDREGRRQRVMHALAAAFFGCLILAALALSGCSTATGATETQSTTPSSNVANNSDPSRTVIQSDASVMGGYDWSFSSRDIDYTYDVQTATKVMLSDAGSTIAGSGATAAGSQVTINTEGTYILSGTLSNGSIVVDVSDENAKVQIVLAGVSITNQSGAAIVIESADKAFITLADSTVNTLADGSVHDTAADGNTHDGVIFSHDDLTLNGKGSLTINANYDNGIVGKDDVCVTSGTYVITAVGHGIQGKDCVKILDGTFTITSGNDGIHSSNDEDETLGYVGIGGGTYTISAVDDGIHAESALLLAAGTVDVIQSYEGLEGRTISVTGGDTSIVASDDGLNAASGNNLNDDQGIATMDTQGAAPGTNQGAAQGTAQGTAPQIGAAPQGPAGDGMGNQGMGAGGTMEADSSCLIEITGGTLAVKAGGDGIDSNGNLTVSGGDTVVESTSTGIDSALDYGGEGTITGGTFVALGATGMAQGFSSSSTQASVMLSGQSTTARTTVTVIDSQGKQVFSFTPSIANNSLLISAADMKTDGTYTIKSGDKTLGAATASLASATNGGMGQGMQQNNTGRMR